MRPNAADRGRDDDASICPIITPGRREMAPGLRDLDEPLHIIEITDPDEAPG
jgi:hypothetical protein